MCALGAGSMSYTSVPSQLVPRTRAAKQTNDGRVVMRKERELQRVLTSDGKGVDPVYQISHNRVSSNRRMSLALDKMTAG